MRSCEYVKVTRSRKTKLLSIKNIKFIKGKRSPPHSDPFLHYADCVLITLELQKKETKNDVITQHRSSDTSLCPVKIWASIIRGIISYPSTHPDSTVNTFMHSNSQLHIFSGQELLQRLRQAAASLGPDVLGFSSSDIGLHSACSRAAMAMYLSGIPVFTIMLLGHWSSVAFLRYIRKQVQEFSATHQWP